MKLQTEISTKITKLTEIHSDIATQYAEIMVKVDYVNVSPLVARLSQSMGMPQPRSKYQPNPTFLEQGSNKDRSNPWYTTASDLMSESDITIITEWLHSSGHDTLFTDPAQFLKLLLDEETGRVLSSMLQDRCTPENQYLSIEQIIDSLDELVSSRKTLSTRRKKFFGSYNTPWLMGVEGCNIDGFLGRDVAACKLETFNWADYQILLCINMLTNGKDEMRLAERLTKVYNAHSVANTRMTLANVGTEVNQFWRDIKETRDLMYNGTKAGGNKNEPGQGQGNKSRRQKKRDKKKAAGTKIIANVTEKDKDKYCFRRGDTSHRVKECIVQGDLKCDIHPNSKSNTNLACFYYRKANNMPTKIRPRPKGPKDTTANGTTPPTGNIAT